MYFELLLPQTGEENFTDGYLFSIVTCFVSEQLFELVQSLILNLADTLPGTADLLTDLLKSQRT